MLTCTTVPRFLSLVLWVRVRFFPSQLPFNLPEEHVRVPASLPSVTEKVFENKVRPD